MGQLKLLPHLRTALQFVTAVLTHIRRLLHRTVFHNYELCELVLLFLLLLVINCYWCQLWFKNN
jgi:hypothetical protein